MSKSTNNNHPINLPLLISVPHGGYTIPHELLDRTNLTFEDIFPDSDPCSQRIYSFQDEVLYFHQSDIARAVVDLNRAPDDLPPQNPDGVIKSHTILNTKVYHEGYQPGPSLRRELLKKYFYPYHLDIRKNSNDPSLLCGLDCHTMLQFPPKISAGDPHERPFICLSNNGDVNGEGDEDELTCSPELLNLLADCLRLEFPDEAENIILNAPFKGGYICRYQSSTLPWIQIELNRKAYLSPPWFNSQTLRVDSKRLEYLRNKFLHALITFCDEAGNIQYPHDISDSQYEQPYSINTLFR